MEKLKVKLKTLKGNINFKNVGYENNFEVEKYGRKNSIILDHVDSNQINAESDHVDLNHVNLNQLITADSATINDSAGVCALNKLLSWHIYLMDVAANKVSKRTQLAYLPSINTPHKPSMVHSLQLYPPVPIPKIFTYVASDPPPSSY